MPKTYDQTCITYKKDKCEIYISPRPVVPRNAALEDFGITAAYFYELNEIRPLYWERVLTLYEWYPDGDVLRHNEDGSTTIWCAKPTMQEIVESRDTSSYYRLYADGSCTLRNNNGVRDITVHWFEEREVDEPDSDNWINQLDVDLGHLHPDLIPEGWFCRKCDTDRCEHIAEEKKKQLNNESS